MLPRMAPLSVRIASACGFAFPYTSVRSTHNAPARRSLELPLVQVLRLAVLLRRVQLRLRQLAVDAQRDAEPLQALDAVDAQPVTIEVEPAQIFQIRTLREDL